MGLISSMYAGVTGLETNSSDLSVIGDNIANANTIGFKASRAAFEDAMAQTLIGGSQVGMGSHVQAIQRLVTQGALTNTGVVTDLAIQGPGFFVVKGSHNGMDGQFYTRAGQFTVDKDGYLVNLEGLRVQGYQADATGAVNGAFGDMLVGANTALPPRATTTVTIKGNLHQDPTAVLKPPFDIANPSATSDFSMSTQVYDSLGEPHDLQVYYRRTGSGTWEWHAITDGGSQTGGTAGTPVEVAAGDLTFDANGNLVTANQSLDNFNPINATNPQPLAFDMGTPGDPNAVGMTQFAPQSGVSFLSQDGYSSGDLARISIDPTGVVTGTYSNGQNMALGQIALADFEAPDQLERIGGNLFDQRPGTGEPNIGHASTGGRGSIVAGALEQSNVDLSNEFVRMITAQRGFQANSKTISTADQLLAELMNLKR